MSRKNIKWLYEEIPGLISKGILTEEDGERLRSFYGEAEGGNGLKTVLTVFGILGAILIGAGIILILAKNWSEMPRGVRTVVSFIPLLSGQGLALYTYMKRSESIAWREGSASFLMISIGTAISLIGQTYNIPGDFDGFVLTWMLLALPLVYLFGAAIPGIFYMVGITAWAAAAQGNNGNALLFWVLLVLVVPFIYGKVREDIYSNSAVFLRWALAGVLCAAIGISLEKVLPGLWIVVYSGYFSTLYLTGLQKHDEAAWWQQPFKTVGALGILIFSFLLTYEWPWKNIGWNYYRHSEGFNEAAGYFDLIIAAAVILIALSMLYKILKRKDYFSAAYGSLAVVSTIGFVLAQYTDPVAVTIILNLYLFGLGIYTVVKGIGDMKLGTTNGGMLIIALLAVIRFFDYDIEYLVRGIAFILAGAGFLACNVVLLRKRGKKNEK
ncbi:MAG: DUF2157 domain-containing protein [Clostridia bacterium]|nr:DUF2157 domain-containing protein [Clostridia bacterium]